MTGRAPGTCKGESSLIQVNHLTKLYGDRVAVDDVSFTAESGRIYGLLGPNGAGKSTILNMITGTLGCTEGEILIDGTDIVTDPLSAKRHIGYLPEVPPLYPEMKVSEYLTFVAEMKQIPTRERAAAVGAVMEKTGLTEVSGRLTGLLSKGYRQRCGIAQAILASPDIIVLDEPTDGLDPAQIAEIRGLIRELGKDRTVILSSHIISEVRAVCDRIMILSCGRLIACDTPSGLASLCGGGRSLHLKAAWDIDGVKALLARVPAACEISCSQDPDGIVSAVLSDYDTEPDLESISRAFVEAGHPLRELRQETPDLEEVYLELIRNDGYGDGDVPGEESDI